MKFINKNNLLTPSQYGFRVNSSTESAITTFYDKLLRNINDKKITCSIFLDLKKAFDLVNILLQKLYYYGFCGPIFNFFHSYPKSKCFAPKLKVMSLTFMK